MAPIAVIIPVYGNNEKWLTPLLHDIAKEQDLVDLYVVDNLGDYVQPTVFEHRILRPGINLGWLRGTNFGTIEAVKNNYQYLCWMNNDVRLSNEFFKGLLDTTSGLLSPCYRGPWEHMYSSSGYSGDASAYAPTNNEKQVGWIDGTCMFMPRQIVNSVGLLDEKFAEFGCGGEIDYSIRAKIAGNPIYVTERSYLYHFVMGTVSSEIKQTVQQSDPPEQDVRRLSRRLTKQYYQSSKLAMTRGLREKWGHNYKRLAYSRKISVIDHSFM